jgi:outer membrane receptor for ferrienterochelin and colicins
LNSTNISLQQGFGNLQLAVKPRSDLDLTISGTVFAGGPTARDRIEVGSDIYYVKREFGYQGVEAKAEATWRPTDSLTTLAGAGAIVDRQSFPAIYNVMKADFGDMRAGDARLTSSMLGGVTLWNPGLHSLAFWTPWRRISFIAGARYDYHNIYGGKPSGRVGGVVALLPSLHFKLLYGSAFKAPSPQLLWGAPLIVGDIAGNRQLKPSYVHTLEGQLTYRPTNYLVFTTGLAYSYLLDQAEFALVGVNQVAQNVAKVESISWESEFKFDWRRKLAAYANLSINRTHRRLDESGYVAALTSYPNLAYPLAVARAGASAAVPWLPLRISVEGSFVSERASSASNTVSAGGRYALAPYFLLGASIHTRGFELLSARETSFALTGRNLLDSQVVDPGHSGVDYPRLGRIVMLQLTQQL